MNKNKKAAKLFNSPSRQSIEQYWSGNAVEDKRDFCRFFALKEVMKSGKFTTKRSVIENMNLKLCLFQVSGLDSMAFLDTEAMSNMISMRLLTNLNIKPNCS